MAYLDPPFNSNRDSDVIFPDESGNATDAQLLRRRFSYPLPTRHLASRETFR